jgi:hypothetical protein
MTSKKRSAAVHSIWPSKRVVKISQVARSNFSAFAEQL